MVVVVEEVVGREATGHLEGRTNKVVEVAAPLLVVRGHVQLLNLQRVDKEIKKAVGAMVADKSKDSRKIVGAMARVEIKGIAAMITTPTGQGDSYCQPS